ncbi:MAG: flippase-like domain-containing protein [Candidatus Aenigmarchaeota archaeon]|nr:flippase-like domain-containing protein [Candidatus Aenigmarchaeota archaeon]
MLTFLLFAVGIVVLAFFGLTEVVNVVTSANMEYLALALALQLVILGLLACRLIVISRRHEKLSFFSAFRISMSGMAISLLTPIAKIGGEPLKIYLLRKKKFTGSEATAIIAVDTLAELASSLLVVLFVFVMFAEHVPGVIFSSFVVFLIVVPRWMRKLIRWTARRISRASHARKKDYARLFYNAFNVLIKDRKILAGSFGISFITKLLEFGRMWLVFAAIGSVLSWDVIVIVWSVILVLYLVPWLPGSLGLVEFFGAGTLVFFGLTSSAAAGGLLLDRFISFWFVLILGLLISTTMPLPKRLKK